jgi:hypothetical protein
MKMFYVNPHPERTFPLYMPSRVPNSTISNETFDANITAMINATAEVVPP